jgi:hypothetical protein
MKREMEYIIIRTAMWASLCPMGSWAGASAGLPILVAATFVLASLFVLQGFWWYAEAAREDTS